MKTTKEHFRIFSTECRRLHKLWGLTDWELLLWHQKCENGNDATQSVRYEQKKGHITLSTELTDGIPITKRLIKDLARHEMCHGMMEPLETLAFTRCVGPDELRIAMHEVVNRLMRLLP